MANQARGGGDTTEFFSHENVPIPPSISKDGHLYHGTKSDLLQELIDTTSLSTSNGIPEVDAVVIDGPAVAHMLEPKSGSTIHEYCEVYLNHIKGYFNKCKRVDVIFDIYVPFSLKQTTRETRRVAPSMIVRGSTKVKNWTRFLKNDSNKESLFEYLATSAIQTYISEDHQLVITYRDGVISNPESVFINENLSPCDHEEADTRMIFHIEEIQKSASSITLRTVDTDVVVLAVAASTRYDGKDIWINFGTGERKKILSARQISAAIGRDKSVALHVFHAFTGCDTVSSFKSIGKKRAWQRWKVFDDVTKAFIDLSNGLLSRDCSNVLSSCYTIKLVHVSA